MKKTILFSLMLVLALWLFSCKGKEIEKSTTSEETTPQESLEYDESYAYYGVELEYNGLHYKIINHNSVVLDHHESYQSFNGDLVIPSTVTYNVEKYYVVCIDDAAFKGCKSLASITIPNSVTSIGKEAFYYCERLTSISVDSENTAYSSDEYVTPNLSNSPLIVIGII